MKAFDKTWAKWKRLMECGVSTAVETNMISIPALDRPSVTFLFWVETLYTGTSMQK